MAHPGFRYPAGIAALFGQPPRARPSGLVVPRVVPARAPGVLTGGKMGWAPQVRPIARPGIGRYIVPVTGIPLTGGQAQAIIGGSGGAAPTIVQAQYFSEALSGTLSSATGTGHCLVYAIVAYNATSGDVPSVTGCTLGGSAGNFAAAATAVSGFVAAVYSLAAIWADPNAASGQTAVAAAGTNLTVNAAGYGLYVWEVAGVVTASVVDQIATAVSPAGGTAWSSGATPTTTLAYEMAIGAGSAGGGTTTQPSGWTNLGGNFGTAGYQALTAEGTATYSGTQGSAASWAAAVVTLKGSSQPVGVSGQAQVSVGPQGLGTIWYPGSLTVQTTSGVNDNSTCNIYLGPPNQTVGNLLLGTIYPGGYGTNGFALPTLQPGQYLTALWTGGNPGDTASINVVGSMSCLALR